MNYAETVAFLYNRLPMFSRIGGLAYRKDLTNTIALCHSLGDPQNKFRSVHIGGTNGKGSVSHMLASILQKAGYKTGLYTSPHLYDFRERIRIDGEMISEGFVIDFVRRIHPMIDKIDPSFFEITVAMTFDYFAASKVDIAVIEVGLGGRLDSTNIIMPELSLITNIGWDHMNMLGNTLAEIAREKAGIVKSHVPVVIGERQPDTEQIFADTAHQKNAPIHFADEEQFVKEYQLNDDYLSVGVYKRKVFHTYHMDLTGIYQLKNILSVLKAVEVLNTKGWTITEEAIKQGLRDAKKSTGLHGRWDIIHDKPKVVLEVAHNKDGVAQMLQHLHMVSYRKLHLILGMVKDKDAAPLLQLLPKAALYYFTQAQIPRALDAHELKTQAEAHALHGETYAEVNMALKQALTIADPEDLILVCGSIFLVAEVNAEGLKS